MVRITDLAEHSQAVKDLIHCAQCGNPMELNGNEFICPRNLEGGLEECQTKPTDSENLLGKVMTCLIDRLMTDGVTQALVEETQRELGKEFSSIQDQISEKHRMLMGLNTQLRGSRANAEQQEQSDQLESDIRALTDQLDSLTAQKKAEPFLKNQEKIAETARDPGTYLDNAQPNETRELLGIFVEDIRVGSESVELIYLRGLPDEHSGTAITAEEIILQ